MPNKYMVSLDWDEVDKIVVDQLKSMINNLELDYNRGHLVFSNDKEEDNKLIKKHIRAAKLVLYYYGGEHA